MRANTTATWRNTQKNAQRMIDYRHHLIGARINDNDDLEFYRGTNAGVAFSLNSVNTETLSGNKTLDFTDAQFQFLDPGGSGRTITLPAEASSKGYFYFIANCADAAEDLTVKDDGGSTIITISQNECGIVVCDGTSWKGMIGANT